MAAEVIRELITNPNGRYLDATTDGGGHAQLIMEHLGTGGQLLGIDVDSTAVELAQARLDRFGGRATVLHGDYRNLAELCHQWGAQSVAGVLFDLGSSSHQLDDPERGFAYRFDGLLDLRFDRGRGEAASAWLNSASADAISEVLFRYGEEPRSRRIARLIVEERDRAPITTSAQLKALVARAVGTRGPILGRACARVWQAIRLKQTGELDAIPIGLNAAIDLLAAGGRLVVIAYHSLEDRLVKSIFREAARACNCPPVYPRCICGANPRGRLVNRRVLRPTAAEVEFNPRARAARMRVFEKRTDSADGEAR